MKTKTLPLIILLLTVIIVLDVIVLLWLYSSHPPTPTPECGIENCHGLNITCGPDIPEVCTEIYMLGDRCRKHASCEIIEGECQLVESEKFKECKSCVEKCMEVFEDDNAGVFECESDC